MKHTTSGLLGLLLCTASAGGAMACDITLRSADTHPNGYPTVEAVKAMGKMLEERTNGRLCVEVFPSSQLGEEKDAIEQTQFGVIDMVRASFGPFNNIIPETQVVSLPYVFRSQDHMHKVMDGPIGDQVMDAFSKHDLVGLAFYDGGSRNFYNSKRPLRSVADFKGLKFRVIQSDIFVDATAALGANATPMPYGEVYSSIQTGVIDGAENNFPSYDSSGHYEVAKYFTEDGHMILPEILAMSQTSWNKLTPEDQTAVKQAAKESVAVMRKLWNEQVEKSKARVIAGGAEVTEIADKTPFIDAMKPVYDKYVTTAEMKDLVQRIQATK